LINQTLTFQKIIINNPKTKWILKKNLKVIYKGFFLLFHVHQNKSSAVVTQLLSKEKKCLKES